MTYPDATEATATTEPHVTDLTDDPRIGEDPLVPTETLNHLDEEDYKK
jgi:hypothetical protein